MDLTTFREIMDSGGMFVDVWFGEIDSVDGCVSSDAGANRLVLFSAMLGKSVTIELKGTTARRVAYRNKLIAAACNKCIFTIDADGNQDYIDLKEIMLSVFILFNNNIVCGGIKGLYLLMFLM